MPKRRLEAMEAAGAAAGGSEDEDSHAADLCLKSVIKVFATVASPSHIKPWSRQQWQSSASGFVVAVAGCVHGRVVLTNAHAVADATALQVRRHGTATKHPARVLAVCHDADVAVLTVDEASFWRGLDPLAWGATPRLQSHVSCVGYPLGGDSISITAGIVSRTTYGDCEGAPAR